MAIASMETPLKSLDPEPELQRVFCIQYPIQVGKQSVQALIDSGSEVNAMHPDFAKKLGLQVLSTNVGAQKIDGSKLDTFGMVIASFSVEDKKGRSRFFQEIFLFADISMYVALGVPFLTLSNVEIDFVGRHLQWRTYTAAEALPTTKRVELIGKKEFAAAALDPKNEAFIVHVASISRDSDFHPSRRAQIASYLSPIRIC